MTRAVVLNWNPGHVLGENLDAEEFLAEIEEGGSVETPWLCRDPDVTAGLPVFLLKKAVEPMGIMASGVTTSATYKKKLGSEFDSWVDASFTKAVDPSSVLPVIDLQSSHYDGAPWRSATRKYPAGKPGWGGVLADDVAARVAKVWSDHHRHWAAGRARRAPNPSNKAPTARERSTAVPEKLEELVAGLLREPDLARPLGTMKPRKKEMVRLAYERNANVVAYVLRRSGGSCELCRQKAPFLRADGTPYLEVHHVKHLAEGGPDCIENAVALCPNCHRRLHVAPTQVDDRETLYRAHKILKRF